MLHQKEKLILQSLLENKDHYITSKELASQLSCSDRTIRTYLKSLMDWKPDETGWKITAKQGYGYRLELQDKALYRNFIETEFFTEQNSAKTENIEDRYNYILNKLLFEQEKLYCDDLAEELFVSRSTLSADFKKIRQDLAKYDLQIESKANRGVYVKGSERNKRRFIMDYFFRDNFFQSLHNYINIEVPGRQISLEELTIIVLDECREGHLKLSDFVIQNLVIHIALSFKRIAEGFQISKIEDWEQGNYLAERKIAEKILHRVYLATGLEFPKEEVDYITLHLISKASCQESQNTKIDTNQEIRKQLLEALEQVEHVKAYQFQHDFQLVEGVVTHLVTLLVRLQNHVVLENPLLKDIQQQYSSVLAMTRELLQAMPIFSKENLSDDEVAYVALHFMAALERLKEKQKFNILVICATGYGSAQMLKNRIDNELGNLVHIVDVIGYYELSDERLKNIDFIISSIDLSNLVFSVPVFTVSIFLNSEELKEIKHRMAQLKPVESSLIPEKAIMVDQNEEKIFDDYFSSACFVLAQDATKEVILQELLSQMGQGEEQDFVSCMQDLMKQREKMSSVIFSEQIAVPHPIKPIAKHHKIGVAIVKNGLQWNEENPHIRLIFLPSPAIYGNEGMATLTSKIVDLLEQPGLQKQIFNCQSFAEFKQLFLKIK
ncbi:BglG family transcription antiterminator [Streptococcus anginosus]|mgnify:FL=1|uniref:BglG family transcription antiterminator n=1 Tax=Streptococcus TaxID=1301 RepID=UPI00039073CE|nr:MULTISPECIES: PRD domain-containing protein [Streptococcus]AGU81324.1 putative transcriptional regulator [Streptococcus anginosus C1051]AIK78144.1 transcription antiterminator BglG [Streptococcus anginosus]MCW1035795.1 BglG family transcription antiterminator [Streptococcus anginosus]OHR63035.1 transcription antiterminator BglG [Streptococcus sp. HMSC034B03]PRT73809.1 PRD domain-containing protein [Streptococcus anginosus]